MGLAKRVIELDRDILTFDQRYPHVESEEEKEVKKNKREKLLTERRAIINYFNKNKKR